ncbi:MAG: hypothetical protein J0H60_21000, partial [Rhizobiales bacterium]|nr:hypothetical protein [Hyphomicrobiales bacterium]
GLTVVIALAALSGLATLPQAEAMFWRQRAVQELVLSPDDPLTALSLLAARPAAITTLDDITRGKYDFDAVGHYARPDVFRLLVDEGPKPAMLNSVGFAESGE